MGVQSSVLLMFPVLSLKLFVPHLAQSAINSATVQKLVAGDISSGDRFGSSVALEGNTALIGAEEDDGKAGAAYVFIRSADGTWTEQAKLVAADRTPSALFGCSVALDGNTALIGAKDEGEYSPGAAYVFIRSGTSWTQQAKLAASPRPLIANFGVSVSVDGDTALIGADDKNSAYVFVRSGGVWTQQAMLSANDSTAAKWFGASVSLDGGTALIGAWGYNNYSQQGAAYVFIRSGSNWTQQAMLIANDGASQDKFGYSVSLSGETALIGAEEKDNGTGTAYVFVRSGNSWMQQAKLTASYGGTASYFGHAVSLTADTALIGTCGFNTSAYLFARSGTNWIQQTRLAAQGNSSACAVAIDSNGALVGEYTEGYYTGAAYIYDSSNGTANKAAVPTVLRLLLDK